MASPENATQSYLYRCRWMERALLNELLLPMNPAPMSMKCHPTENLPATCIPIIIHADRQEWITLPDHQALSGSQPAKPAKSCRQCSFQYFIFQNQQQMV